MFADAGGVRLHYEVHGSKGPWLTLVHGGLVDSRSWEPVVGDLAADHRVITYDVRGFGCSDRPPPGSYSLEASVEDLGALWRHVGVTSGYVVGFSQGGVIAQAAAFALTSHVKGLVLIGTYACRRPSEIEAAERRAADAERDGINSQICIHLERVFSPRYLADHPTEASRYIERLAEQDPVAFAATMRAMSRVELSAKLPALRVPVVVVVGAEDVAVGLSHAEALVALIPGAELVVVPDCGHTVAIEQPEALVRIVRDLVGRASADAMEETASC
jgi:pimeloyl-ACP methyl ester carboxylesterase